MADLTLINADKLKEAQDADNKPKPAFQLTKSGTVKATSVQNVALILQIDDKLRGRFKWNNFSNGVDVANDIDLDLSQWGIGKITLHKGPITDQTIEDLAMYMDTYPDYQAGFKLPLIMQGISTVSRMYAYNPVVDYLDQCHQKWDKKTRVNAFFPTFLGVEDTPANRLIAKLFFLGIVAKAYNPEVKFDWVLDLVGGQGIGKTTLLKKISPLDMYTDQFLSFTDKDDYSSMRTAIIVNDDEMTVSNKTSFEEIKKFITMQEFAYRPPYGHTIVRFHKRFVMARTTNEVQHLRDKSGDRRFNSLLCRRDHQVYHPVTHLHKDLVDQIYGEMVDLYLRLDDPFNLSPEENALLDAARDQFASSSPLEDMLNDVLENEFVGRDFITNKELWRTVAIAQGQAGLTENQKKKLRYYMENLGWQSSASKKINGKAYRGYAKK